MYQYKAYTLDKEIVQGTIDAPNESSAEELLHGAGYHQILTLNKKPSPFSLEKLFLRSSRVKKSDIIDFFQQLATLLDSQMPFIQALWLLAEQATKPSFKKCYSQAGTGCCRRRPVFPGPGEVSQVAIQSLLPGD